ncbi:MAG: sugar phosphate isomerase/epimerase family protein [Pirellulales bacterium]
MNIIFPRKLNVRSAITVSLVPEAKAGPFVFHDGLQDACQHASQLGFDAIEIFPPSADAVTGGEAARCVKEFGLQVAAVGTGAGWVKHQLSLTSLNPDVRNRALEFIRSIIVAAGGFQAPAIIGSMQGKIEPGQSRDEALKHLASALEELSNFAAHQFDTKLLIEPLNRYESNVLNRVDETAEWLKGLQLDNVRILADLFHMNIEEADMAAAIRSAGHIIGHVHFADSNRSAVGFGHSPIADSVAALKQIGYNGYLSAEILPRPNARAAAEQTISSFRRLTTSE